MYIPRVIVIKYSSCVLYMTYIDPFRVLITLTIIIVTLLKVFYHIKYKFPHPINIPLTKNVKG